MSKKPNPLIIFLLPIAALWSCITGSDKDETVRLQSSEYTEQVEHRTPVSAVAPGISIVSEQSAVEKTEAGDTQCKVVGVVDGDTLTCLTDTKEQIKVRLNQIDAPEQKQDFGKAAKKVLSGYVFGKTVNLKTNRRDKYGRTIAEVYLGTTNINKAMVESGYAWAYREYMTDNDYVTLEESARSQSKGVWSQPNPIYPSEFRHGTVKTNVTEAVEPQPDVSSDGFTCSGKRFCRQMRSCAEARFYLNQCGVHRLDRDNDGRPCESLC